MVFAGKIACGSDDFGERQKSIFGVKGSQVSCTILGLFCYCTMLDVAGGRVDVKVTTHRKQNKLHHRFF